MRFTVITHVGHGAENGAYFAYAPYVREMNIWIRHVDEVTIVAPMELTRRTAIEDFYKHEKITVQSVKSFDITGFRAIIRAIVVLPGIFFSVARAMKSADHIHLRCPGNMGLVGCIVQLFFPKKPKTAKYAGNWDPDASQPLSYRLQKYILSNTFLTRNMQVLAYGKWDAQSSNIKPFFTATYSASHAGAYTPRSLDGTIRFVFVGTLSPGKRPLYTVQLIAELAKQIDAIRLDIYGEGAERKSIEAYIKDNGLADKIRLHGNQDKEVVTAAYRQSHFVVLASKSEGWPKVIAEAMFWGCVPLVSNVSCVAEMIGQGSRGLMLNLSLEKDVDSIVNLIADKARYHTMSVQAQEWSQAYTTERFDDEIQKVLC